MEVTTLRRSWLVSGHSSSFCTASILRWVRWISLSSRRVLALAMGSVPPGVGVAGRRVDGHGLVGEQSLHDHRLEVGRQFVRGLVLEGEVGGVQQAPGAFGVVAAGLAD